MNPPNNTDTSFNVFDITTPEDKFVFLTGRCNADCIFCPQHRSDESDFASPSAVKDFVRALPKDTVTIGITGGEPTLARPILVEFLKSCRDELPRVRVDLLTNGILLSDLDYVKELSDIGCDGLVFEIPLYSDTPFEHNHLVGVDGFEKTMLGLFNLLRFRQRIAIRTVINAKNYQRLPRLAEFICRNLPFVSHVALMGMEVFHKARENADSLWIDAHDYLPELESAVRILNRAAMVVSIYNHQLCVLPRPLWRFAKPSISQWKRRYLACCSECYVQADCGGTFSTSGSWTSAFIRPVGDRCDM